MSHSHRAKVVQSIAIICTAYAAYAVADAITKWIAQFYSIPQLIVMNSAFVFIILGGFILIRKGIKGFYTPNFKLHMIRAVVIAITATCIVHALPMLPLADFYGIAFTSPFWVLILAALFLGEHIGWRRWAAVAAGFTGVLVLAGPSFDSALLGIILVSIASVSIACSAIISRKIGADDYLPLYGFYAVVLVLPLNLPFAVSGFQIPDMQHLPILALQWGCFTIGQIGFSYGFAKAPEAAIIAPFHYTQIIWGTAFGFLIFGDIPTWTTIAGLILIIGAGLFTIYREYKISHPGS